MQAAPPTRREIREKGRAHYKRVLRRAMADHGVSQSALALACGVAHTLVEHWLDLDHDARPGLENIAMMPEPIRHVLIDALLGELGETSWVGVPADPRAHVAQVVEVLGACSTAFARVAVGDRRGPRDEPGEHELRGVRDAAKTAKEHAAGVEAWAAGQLDGRPPC